MGRFKFRAWDPDKKQMITDPEELHSNTFNEPDNGFHCGYLGGGGDWTHCPITQSTGLRDKNGVEIYEGDIVNLDTLCRYEGGGTIWRIKPHKVVYDRQRFLPDRLADSEVIGNIYEHPDKL